MLDDTGAPVARPGADAVSRRSGAARGPGAVWLPPVREPGTDVAHLPGPVRPARKGARARASPSGGTTTLDSRGCPGLSARDEGRQANLPGAVWAPGLRAHNLPGAVRAPESRQGNLPHAVPGPGPGVARLAGRGRDAARAGRCADPGSFRRPDWVGQFFRARSRGARRPGHAGQDQALSACEPVQSNLPCSCRRDR